jgi:preprotein translocase subunit SecE
VARNRKRAKERRARRTDGRNGGRRVAAGGAEAAPRPIEDDELAAPSPIEHAMPDVELADAQLEVGRAEPIEDAEDELEFEEEAEAEALGGPPGGGGRRLSPPNGQDPAGAGGGRGAEFAIPASAATAQRVSLLARLIGFLEGSWRELQRVQWPDRRQVAQATGVVIGFVIVAGVFLGLADLAFSHLVNFILK